MTTREYEITIGKDGMVEVLLCGFKGRACLDAAKVFTEIVGSMQQQRPTAEFFEPEEDVRLAQDQRH